MNKTFKNFSRLFHCSVINVLKLFCYLLTGATLISYHVVLGLSRTFFNFFIFLFAVWLEVLLIFFVEAFVLRRFLNSEAYNIIVLLVCQQIFLFFLKKATRRFALSHISDRFLSYLFIYDKVVSFALNPMARISSVVSHMQFLFSSGNPIPRLSVRLKALRSVLRIIRKCFWSFLKIKRFDQASIRCLWFVSRFLRDPIVSYPVRSFHHARLKTMSNSRKVPIPILYPNRNRLTDQAWKPAVQRLAQCLWNVLINMIIQVYISFELLHENPSFGLAVSPPFGSGNTNWFVFSLIIPVILPASTTFGKA